MFSEIPRFYSFFFFLSCPVLDTFGVRKCERHTHWESDASRERKKEGSRPVHLPYSSIFFLIEGQSSRTCFFGKCAGSEPHGLEGRGEEEVKRGPNIEM